MNQLLQIRPRVEQIRYDADYIRNNLTSPVVVPDDIDLLVTGICPFRCPGCYGPDHNEAGSLDNESFQRITHTLAEFGLRGVVISGGEPTSRRGLTAIMASVPKKISADFGPGARELRNRSRYNQDPNDEIRLTLSTTGQNLLKRHRGALEILNARKCGEIAVHLDGPTPAENDQMIPPLDPRQAGRGFFESINLIRVAQRDYQNAKEKLRSLATAQNIDRLVEIPATLEKAGIDISRLIWKIYEINDFEVGPRAAAIAPTGLKLSTAEFRSKTQRIIEKYGNKMRIDRQFAIDSAENYTKITPSGIVVTVKMVNGKPREVPVGNLATRPIETFERLSTHTYAPLKNLGPGKLALLHA